MSERVHVHAPHERVMELIATLLLALATLGIAWSGYQGARWNGEQAEEYSASNATRAHALPRPARRTGRKTC
jgi:hypothetical protein